MGATKGYLPCKDKSGNKFMVSKDDIRYLSGEVIGTAGKWVIIDNIKYSKKEVMKIFNISLITINNIIKNKTKDWYYSK